MNQFKYIVILLMSLFGKVTMENIDAAEKQDTTINRILSTSDFNRIINKQFSNLITGQAANSPGGYAALDIEKGSVNFAPNYILKNGNIISLKAIGGISDGMFEIFNHSELNTNLTLDLQFHLMNRLHKTKLVYDHFEYKDLLIAQNKIDEAYSKDSLTIVKHQELNALRLEKIKLDKQLSILKKKQTDQKFSNDSLDYAIAESELKIKSMEKRLEILLDPDWEMESLLLLGNKRANDYDKANAINLHIEGFQMGWFSFGYQISNDAFKTFDPSLAFADQIKRENFVSHEFRVQYSYYRWSADYFKTFFVSGGLAWDYKSNFENLTRTEITEVNERGSQTNSRTTTKKYIAYEGDLIKGQNKWVGYADLYYFLFTNNKLGVHLFPNVQFATNQDPVCNFSMGLVFPFKDQKNEKSIVNAEIYYCFTDLFKTTESTFRLYERNKIGLRFAFPINFNLNKN